MVEAVEVSDSSNSARNFEPDRPQCGIEFTNGRGFSEALKQ